MDLATIADRTGLPTRKLRYVLDHGVLPGKQVKSYGRGVARSFTEFEAFGIACAAYMLEAGVRRNVVETSMDLLTTTRVEPTRPQKSGHQSRQTDSALFVAYLIADEGRLEVADGVNVRMTARCTRPPKAIDTGWLQAETGHPLADDYEPMTSVTVNVGRLRRGLRGTA